MSRDLFEIGARLRAAHDREAAESAAYAPVLPPVTPIAAVVQADGDRIRVDAASDTGAASGAGRDGLAALAALGADIDAPHRTLVVGTAAEAGLLAALARRFHGEPAAAVVGWWDQRIDYPGTEAVHVAADAARLRWVLGVHPDKEGDPAIWRQWLGVPGDGPEGLLNLARRTAAGPTLPGLVSAARADADSWSRYQGHVGSGHPWWAADTRIDAALGLAGRAHAAEWYESLRLADPRVALAAAHDGTVVPGTVTAADDREAVIRADRPLSRLRAGGQVEAWRGEPADATPVPCLSGRVRSAEIDAAGCLRIAVASPNKRISRLEPGARVCLRPAHVDEFMQATGRRLMAAKLFRGSNWIAGRGAPPPRRGTVPLDVVVAAADLK